MAALANANEVRLARRAIRRKLFNGEIGMLEALRERCCATATVYSMLIAQRRWGDRRTLRFLREMGNVLGGEVLASRQVCQLTERQVEAIVSALGERTT